MRFWSEPRRRIAVCRAADHARCLLGSARRSLICLLILQILSDEACSFDVHRQLVLDHVRSQRANRYNRAEAAITDRISRSRVAVIP